MKDRIVIDPGRPKGYVKATCLCCGYTAYIHGSEFSLSQNGGRYSFGRAWTDCGRDDCDAKISISVTSIPDDVEIPK